MELNEIKEHWDSISKRNRTALSSTTKTATIKRLEVDAFVRAIRRVSDTTESKTVLEVGCGNGFNIFGLAREFPNFIFRGLDYIEDMISAAEENRQQYTDHQISFDVADVLEMGPSAPNQKKYDFVITNRLIINLNSWELQQQALSKLLKLVKSEGHLIIIENFEGSYGNQNLLRQLIELPARVPDQYNKFLNENIFEEFLRSELSLDIVLSENFASLHDIMLYVLIPHIDSGKVNYDHPLMESVTALLEKLPEEFKTNFGNFGQNRLYLLRRS